MNLNNLKPAWQRFRLLNSMQLVDRNEILAIIEADVVRVGKTYRPLILTIMFIALTIFCQGG